MHSGDTITRSAAGAAAAAPPPGDLFSAPPPTSAVIAPGERTLTRLKWLVAGTLVLLVAMAAVRLWFVSGLWSVARIDGPSLAPALCGAHYRVICDDCRFPFRCDAEHAPADGRAVCPNCGYQENDLNEARLEAGEPVLIDRWPLLFRGPRRHEIVAAADPTTPGEVVVKRVAALPGERLEIRDGDLYAGGRIVRKSPSEMRQVRTLVHDNDYQPQKTRGLPARWESRSSTGWHSVGNAIRHERHPVGTHDFDRLVYSHWRCIAGPGERTKVSPILDNDSYNQADSRELNVVRDVHVTCELEVRQPGTVVLTAPSRSGRSYAAVLDFSRREVVLQSLNSAPALEGLELDRRPLSARLTGRRVAIEFGIIDHQLLLAIGGQTIFLRPLDDTDDKPPTATTTFPLEIWASSSAVVEVSQLRVWRDVYYLDPVGLPRPWRAENTLPPGQFALLGDNAPVSIDSRNWLQTGVPRASIMGRVYRPFWAPASTD